MALVLAFMYTVCMSIKTLVLEKEARLKEVLRAAGLPNGALWAARFTESLALLAVPCALISVLVKVSGGAGTKQPYLAPPSGPDADCNNEGLPQLFQLFQLFKAIPRL